MRANTVARAPGLTQEVLPMSKKRKRKQKGKLRPGNACAVARPSAATLTCRGCRATRPTGVLRCRKCDSPWVTSRQPDAVAARPAPPPRPTPFPGDKPKPTRSAPTWNRELTELDVEEIVAETDLAFLCRIEGVDHWFPKSQIDEPDGYALGDRGITMVVSLWFADLKGLA